MEVYLRRGGELGISIHPELAVELDSNDPSPGMGCRFTKVLLSRRRFTALFAYNDISAIGAMRAIREAGLRVPGDISWWVLMTSGTLPIRCRV